MRYVRFVIEPRDGYLDEIDRRVATSSALEREYLHNLNRLEDGTVSALYEVSGDPDAAERIAEEIPSVLDYQLAIAGDRITIFGRIEPSQLQTDLLDLLDEYELVLETPLAYTESGNLRAAVVGSDETIRRAMADVPDTVSFDIEQVSEYEPETERLFSMLTDRQQETLLAALEVGYYRVPREATQQDVAAKLDRSPATVGEHLRKVEETLFSAIAPT